MYNEGSFQKLLVYVKHILRSAGGAGRLGSAAPEDFPSQFAHDTPPFTDQFAKVP